MTYGPQSRNQPNEALERMWQQDADAGVDVLGLDDDRRRGHAQTPTVAIPPPDWSSE